MDVCNKLQSTATVSRNPALANLQARVYRFDSFLFDQVERILLRDTTRVSLTPKVFDILSVLIESAGHLVTKASLIEKIWPDAFVEEANLSVHIATLRKALGQRVGRHYIETVRNRGYRFIARVLEVESESALKILTHEQEPVTSQYRRDPIDGEGRDPHFTFHSTLRVGPLNKSYDPSYGVVEDEVGLIKAVNSAGVCLTGAAANAARIISTNLGNLFAPGNREIFFDACSAIAVPPPHSAAVVGQSIPAFMDAGSTYLVSITMQNNGSNTWTQAEGYRLGSQNPHDNWIWGLNRVQLPASVSPGGQVTFDFYVTAPINGGTYNFQWRMVKEFVEWFGDPTPNILINVQASPMCDPFLEQQCWNRGGSWDATACQCYGGCNGSQKFCFPEIQ